MTFQKLVLFRGHGQFKDAASKYNDYVSDAISQSATGIYIYQAIPDGVKGIEDYLVLCSITAPVESYPDPSSSSEYSRDVKPAHPAESPPPTEINGVPTFLSPWDSLDDVDYKNTPDYDPNQEESVYDSTPEPEESNLEATSTKHRTVQEPSYVESYVKLGSVPPDSTDDNIGDSKLGKAAPFYKLAIAMIPCDMSDRKLFQDVNERFVFRMLAFADAFSTALANYLLLLFIPAPLELIDPSDAPSSRPTTWSRHDNFIAHFMRYPYLTSHDSYVRHTGYFLESADENVPSQYLVVEEFSDLEPLLPWRKTRFKLNYEQKRIEAKHWWRKEGRGASGVKAGFYKLADLKYPAPTGN